MTAGCWQYLDQERRNRVVRGIREGSRQWAAVRWTLYGYSKWSKGHGMRITKPCPSISHQVDNDRSHSLSTAPVGRLDSRVCLQSRATHPGYCTGHGGLPV